jgi:hypothetical protein
LTRPNESTCLGYNQSEKDAIEKKRNVFDLDELYEVRKILPSQVSLVQNIVIRKVII